ncbi:hypothetical protein CYMTET_17982 [Cymbomonas tetramitiformis]|uniref:Fe2OG dioxygenase domain-containing protein n=1 Tax=Cymbomonas tetramitiformis TaxID=36881 RepID=A0AAE0G9F5_9CHLO|nr:hypothetical protein CYMTET_17982 [Cymbomonas tetramitiformis]|eukprot:gene10659-12606_t
MNAENKTENLTKGSQVAAPLDLLASDLANLEVRDTPDEAVLGSIPLPSSLSDDLAETGYSVCGTAAGKTWTSAVREEITSLHAKGLMQKSLNRLATSRAPVADGGSPGHTCEKPGVSELNLIQGGQVVAEEAMAASPVLRSWFHGTNDDCCGGGLTAMLAKLQDGAPWLALTHLDTLKIQFNEGVGGCFPLHRDTQDKTGRKLTAILYLGENWEATHGGELRLLPFPLAPVNVAPRAGQLVLFSSVATLHRVMPAKAAVPRCVVSLWFGSGGLPGGDLETPPTDVSGKLFPWRYPKWIDPDQAEQLAFLRLPKNADMLTKILYAEEMAESIEEAFGKSEGVQAALALHFEEAARTEAAVNKALLELLRETLPLTCPAESYQA